jgi:hypothetical protein
VLLEGTNFTAVEGVLHRLFSLRSDPSKNNDGIRKKLIIKLLDAGLVPQAKSVASELSTTASPLLQIKLILAGAYVEFGVLIALILVVILGGTFLLWGRRAVRPTSTSNNSRRRATSSQQQFVDEDEPEQPRRFVVYSHGIKVGQGVDEYTDCLRVFALKPGASLKKIKVAYRNAVKACHPDLNPHAGPQEAARFIQLTKSYERLLQLHEQRTGER